LKRKNPILTGIILNAIVTQNLKKMKIFGLNKSPKKRISIILVFILGNKLNPDLKNYTN